MPRETIGRIRRLRITSTSRATKQMRQAARARGLAVSEPAHFQPYGGRDRRFL
jgi:hypothetical protein